MGTKPKSISLHIGLNSVDPGEYGGWSGDLCACEFDARDMEAIAKSRKMSRTLLLTKSASRSKVLDAIRAAAKALGKGDLFLVTYSGHGGQVPDVSGDEPDKLDETWCLYDGQLIDDELYLELGRFAPGVRIFVLSDSCHSGSVVRAGPPDPGGPHLRPKQMPRGVAIRTYTEHQQFYDDLQRAVAKAAGKSGVLEPRAGTPDAAVSARRTAVANRFKPALLLISGCQDNQTSMDGDHNGAFTEQLLLVWDHARYRGNYARFYASIKARMPAAQTPNLFSMGDVAAFVSQEPFSL
jgi:hypothetical protein